MRIKTLLVDDHRIMREGLRALLVTAPDLELIGEAKNGRDALQMIEQMTPDVVVMDLSMPGLNGIEATRQAVNAHPELKVVCLSAHKDEKMTVEMLRAGAVGYVVKDSAFEELVNAIRSVAKGEVYLSPSVAGTVVNDFVRQKLVDSSTAYSILSVREREVLQLIAEGQATKEIAAHLQVSTKTAETHRRNLMGKLNIDTVAELTKFAVRERNYVFVG